MGIEYWLIYFNNIQCSDLMDMIKYVAIGIRTFSFRVFYRQ
jgi:hypothetical protein